MPGWSQLQVVGGPGCRARGIGPDERRDEPVELDTPRKPFTQGETRVLAGKTKLDTKQRALAGD